MALHPVVNQNVSYVSLDGQTVEEVDKTDDNRMQIFLPKWRTQELSTRVVVGTGQSIMMGGVLEREQRTVVESVPILGNIPGLGSLFRKRATLDKPRYLLIFVTATLIDEDGSFITYEKPEEGPVAPVRAPRLWRRRRNGIPAQARGRRLSRHRNQQPRPPSRRPARLLRNN